MDFGGSTINDQRKDYYQFKNTTRLEKIAINLRTQHD